MVPNITETQKEDFFIPLVAIVMEASQQNRECRLNQGNTNWHTFMVEIPLES